ncbi:DUF4252 domain-containing protein [Flagellimonas aquimarina]|uniref:DUF4252 domain-containing protein n=1 Tax=Flagellimonas aquimarina TaxID=2201895 RepID=A0A316KWF4_9FLAO|nr:DUF4252 domain-containing protein [Allomuricauda koreensis]PWL38567.1 DUF4252 domain-containing protein [Allomuricauda koreensis]
MKKLLIIILCACAPFLGNSQSIFDKFEDSDRIGSVTINKGMLDIVSKMMENDSDPENQEFVEIARNINNIKIFLSEDEGAAADMATTMKQYVRSSKLEELMKVKDGDTNLKFYVKYGKDDDHVEELLMFATGIEEKKNKHSDFHFETVLLTMTGNIDLAKVGTLTNKMKLHKGLKKVKKQ